MERSIWKFVVPVKQVPTVLEMPAGALVVHVGQQQSGAVTFWADVDPRADKEQRTFAVRGTGHPVEAGLRFLGTTMDQALGLVWHLFEVPSA